MRTGSLHTRFGPDFLEFGSSAVQSTVMQFGASRGDFGTMANGSPIPWGDIPARPFIGLSHDDEITINDILSENIAAFFGSG